MSAAATWKVVVWNNRPADTTASFPLGCECGQEAELPCAPLVGGSLSAITCERHMLFEPPWFEPPDDWIPTVIECRKCGRRLASETIEPEDL
jgi:hypothetical protein